MTRRQRLALIGVALVAVLLLVLVTCRAVQQPEGGPDTTPTQEPDVTAGPTTPLDARLTWAPPKLENPETRTVTRAGTISLEDDRDYIIRTPNILDKPVMLRGGRNVVWIGGHIRIDDQGPDATATQRRALVIRDGENAQPGRVVHLEGLLIDGADLSEGINTACPSATVQIQSTRILGVHFHDTNDRDGKPPYRGGNHPDIVQTWGGVGELRIDKLTGTSAYQGLFLKADQNPPTGPIWLRRIDLTAIAHRNAAGETFYGQRLLFWDAERTGPVRIDNGTVWIAYSRKSQWGPQLGDNVRYPVSATETRTADQDRDQAGEFVTWSLDYRAGDGSPSVSSFTGEPARVYGGAPAQGNYVPADIPGPGYRSTGYRTAPQAPQRGDG